MAFKDIFSNWGSHLGLCLWIHLSHSWPQNLLGFINSYLEDLAKVASTGSLLILFTAGYLEPGTTKAGTQDRWYSKQGPAGQRPPQLTVLAWPLFRLFLPDYCALASSNPDK